MDYDPDCSSCDISQGLVSRSGGILKLPGEWIANQYGGPEGFLGWLALQPRYHRDSIPDLTDKELHALGPNLKLLDDGLRQYWSLQYPRDQVVQVYVACFREAGSSKPALPDRYHLHIHVIPRFESLACPLRACDGELTWVDAWHTGSLARRLKVPEPYQHQAPMWEQRAEALMDYLRHELADRP